jgi:hypothetical protein
VTDEVKAPEVSHDPADVAGTVPEGALDATSVMDAAAPLPDVSPSALAVIPRSREEAQAIARRIGGEKPKDEAHLHCVSCGWSGTIRFTSDELEALDGDAENYCGPCPGVEKDLQGRPKKNEQGQDVLCGAWTLQPMRLIAGDQLRSINEIAAENRRRELREQGEVIGDVVGDKIVSKVGSAMGDMILGSMGPIDPGSDSKG